MTSMGDLPARVWDYLNADSGVSAAFGGIYAEADAPPVKATIEAGPYLCTKFRGGQPVGPGTIHTVDLQVTIYAKDFPTAWAAYAPVYAALVEPSGGPSGSYEFVIWGQVDNLPQSLTSAAGWPMLLAYFTVYVRSEE